MGVGDPEEVRVRVYGGEVDPEDAKLAAFVDRLAGEGVIDCPAYDPWVAALRSQGWLPAGPRLEPNPEGPGRVGRWLLTPHGLAEWARIRGTVRE